MCVSTNVVETTNKEGSDYYYEDRQPIFDFGRSERGGEAPDERLHVLEDIGLEVIWSKIRDKQL